MSQAPSPYPGQSAFYSPHSINPSLNRYTPPPPPPPKPSSHDTSRRGTPQTQQSLPSAPQPSSQDQFHGSDDHHPEPAHATSSPSHPAGESALADPTALLEPPGVDEGWLPDIVTEKSTTDLQHILHTPALISALSAQHPACVAHHAHLQSLLSYNTELTTRLLDLEAHLKELRTSTEQLLLAHQSLEVTWRKKQAEMDAALAPWSPKGLYQRLGAGIAEQEAICRAVEESFLERDHDRAGRATEKEVADWVRRVKAEATTLAARREAKARWDEGRVGGWR